MRLMPASVCAVVWRDDCTSAWYAALSTLSRIPASPIVCRRRSTKNAATRVPSAWLDCDQTAVTAWIRSRTSFLNDNIYGSSGRVADTVNRRVPASDKWPNSSTMLPTWLLSNGAMPLNFLPSVSTLTLPVRWFSCTGS